MTNLGAAAERQAAEFLQRNGLRLLQSNFRCKFGEIDLILLDGETVVFAEVRLRSTQAFGGAAASITAAKRTRLLRTAAYYLQAKGIDAPCRFDAVLLEELGERSPEWIKHAFEGD